jgi:hypothetical protein
MQVKERSWALWVMILLLAAILIALLFSTYHFKATQVDFGLVSKQSDYAGNRASSTSIQIITSTPTSPIGDILPTDFAVIQDIDYSRYFIVAVFFGFGASQQDNIMNVAQFYNVVWIEANFTDPPAESNGKSPYQIIKIESSSLRQYGDITFKLVNQVFVDKAKANQIISPASS